MGDAVLCGKDNDNGDEEAGKEGTDQGDEYAETVGVKASAEGLRRREFEADERAGFLLIEHLLASAAENDLVFGDGIVVGLEGLGFGIHCDGQVFDTPSMVEGPHFCYVYP